MSPFAGSLLGDDSHAVFAAGPPPSLEMQPLLCEGIAPSLENSRQFTPCRGGAQDIYGSVNRAPRLACVYDRELRGWPPPLRGINMRGEFCSLL